MEGGLVLVPCLVVETKEECYGVLLSEKRERERGGEDMGFLYVAEDGLVALLMESMHLECRVERERVLGACG